MAIRDVGPKPSAGAGAPGHAGGLPPGLAKGLSEAGLLESGKNPKEAAQGLVMVLGQAGFQPPARGDLAAQLTAALRAFQQAHNLPATGQLNAATAEALRNAGLLGSPEAQHVQLKKPDKDGFERPGATSLKQGERQRADMVNQGTPDTNFLDALLNQLGPGGTHEGMSPSDVRAAAQASEAYAQSAEKKAQVAEAKKGEASPRQGEGAQRKGSSTDAQKELELPTNQQLDRGNAAGVKVMRGLRTESARTDEKRRRDSVRGKEPTELGVVDEEAEEDALEGAGEGGQQKKRGQGGDQGGASDEGSDDRGAAGPAEDGRERERGNASSGDADHLDERRGNASLDDGSEDGAGHHLVPSLGEQAATALQLIVKDSAVENRATTYSWDVTFLRPGVYGPGQKAQELVHLVVHRATPFDPVWNKAQANIAILVKRLDPSAVPPSLDDIIQAIRQARARDGDEDATGLKKVLGPIGRP